MSKKKKNNNEPKLYHNGFPIDSTGELWFLYWCEELKNLGYIDKIERGKSYLLCNGLINSYLVQLKTKAKSMTETILMPHSYTSDFTITWKDEGKELFCNKFGEKWKNYFICTENLQSHVECKPEFDFNNMERLAKVNIKFVWDKYQDFIQIVTNTDLFKNTFVPEVLIKTKVGKDRKFNFKVRTLNEFIHAK